MIIIKNSVKIIMFLSIIYTISIIGVTLTISAYIDKVKTEELVYKYRYEVLQLNDYDLTLNFLDIWRGKTNKYDCNKGEEAINQIVWYMRDIGEKLSRYGQSSTRLSEKDFDYLKRKYYLLELKEYILLNKLKERCNNITIITFFFKREDKDSQIMGRVIAEASSDLNHTYVLSFDAGYNDLSLLNIMKEKYNITDKVAPIFIINDKCIYKGLYNRKEVVEFIEKCQ